MLYRSIVKRMLSTNNMGLSHDFSIKRILTKEIHPFKKTKLVCTIGPTSDDVKTLEEMIKRGLNVARINFSHDDHEIQYQKLCRIREAIKNCGAEGRVGIMLDTKGPEIRTGLLEKGKIQFTMGDTVKVTPNYSIKCNKDMISLSYPSLLKSISPGKMILIADGNLALEVLEVDYDNNYLVAKCLNDYLLGERKNVNLPGVVVDMPVITEKDENDIVNFGIKHDVDFIALSFTRSPECVRKCRDVLGEKGKHIKVVPKIENQEGLENLEEIVKISDGIMMARGDLGMEILPSKVLLSQKYMTGISRQYGRPVICATQMLESMTDNPRPTRAEMSDVGNAVLDSVDSVMLSGETGNGQYILESVNTMNDICREVEQAFDYSNYYRYSNREVHASSRLNKTELGLAKSAVKMAIALESECIVVLSKNEFITKHISNLRPNAFIVYPSSQESRLRKLNLSFGVIPCLSSFSKNYQDYLDTAVKMIRDSNLLVKNKNVVVVNAFENEVKVINI